MALPPAETVTRSVVAAVTPAGDVDGGDETWPGMYGVVKVTDPALPGTDSGFGDADDGMSDTAGVPATGTVGKGVVAA